MADKYTTVAGAGLKDGTDWANAFSMAEWKTDLETLAAAGDYYWIAGGTYIMTALVNTSRDGIALNHINIIGVDAGTSNEPPIVSDYADGTNRPFIDGGASYQFILDNYWSVRNLRFESANTPVFRADVDFFGRNCSFKSTGVTSSYLALQILGDRGIVIDCEILSASSNGASIAGNATIINSYFKVDSQIALTIGAATKCYNSIFDSCSTGIVCGVNFALVIEGNTFYNCTTAISGTTTAENMILNNTISNCTDGINFSSTSTQLWVDYNNYYTNTTDVTGVTKGPNATAVDPQFTDAPSGDFSLDSASALIGAGFGIRLGVGL